jgi:hypothetical protein
MEWMPARVEEFFYKYIRSLFLILLITLFAVSAFAAQVTLEWNLINHSELVGYKLYYGNVKGQYPTTIKLDKVTSYTVENLIVGKQYYFALTALLADGSESPRSNVVAFIPSPQVVDSLEVTDTPAAESDPNTATASDETSTTGAVTSDELSETDPVSSAGTSETAPVTPVEDLPAMEFGDVEVNHQWKRIDFKNDYKDPVVVAKSLSYNGSHPAVVRIADLDRTGFSIRVQEWDYLDGRHATEVVGYLVLERGVTRLSDGSVVEADWFETDNNGIFETVTFQASHPQTPVVVTAMVSDSADRALVGRIKNITQESFDFRLQMQEKSSLVLTTEKIAYVAWEPSYGCTDAMMFDIGSSPNAIRQSFAPIYFQHNFDKLPVFVSDMQTYDGVDTANIRWSDKRSDRIFVNIDEEQSRDLETSHTTEVVGYMAFSE